MKIYIETERLLLREVTEADAQGLFELDSDPEVHKYLGNKPIKSIEESEETVQYIRGQYEANGIGRWAVVDKTTNEFVGWSGLKYETQVRDDFPYYDLGYRLKRKFWGKGIATETAIVSLKYGFENLKLSEIFAGAHIHNIGSNKVLQKVGLRYIETFEYDGEPHHWYGLKKSEWLANQ